MTEAELLESVRELCGWYRLLCYHTQDSRRCPAGFPDLVIVGKRVLYRELKSQTGIVSVRQVEWLLRLEQAGADAEVWRPEQWPWPITDQLRAIRW